VLKEAEKKGGERRVDIVLDNAGFELFVDLILAGYLLETKLATTVVLHPKSLPWFVSDVLVEDFGALLGALADPTKFFNTPEDDEETKEKISLTEEQVDVLKFLFSNFAGHHGEGGLVIRPNRFWTTADSYWRLPYTAPGLFEDLKESELVVFKGDLNYRKLTADAAWDPTTPFEEAIGPLGKKGSGMRTLALRTCKADVVVGLKPGLDEELKAGTVERKWGWSGKYAVVQFWDGKAE
jgi:damage-control phosphatase, subfamily III